MKLAVSANIRAITLALLVAGFALWWYFKPFPWLGATMAVISGAFTYFILITKRKQRLQRILIVIIFIIFLATILVIIYVDNNLSAFLDWAFKHPIEYYRAGESLRSTLFPCTLTISQVFLGQAAYYLPATGSWMTTFPPSLDAFLLVMVPFVVTMLVFGRGICGWMCPFGGLPEAMVTGKKERWQLNFLRKRVVTADYFYHAGLAEWVIDVKYGVLLASILLAVFLVVPIVCLLCPVLWLTAMPAFWTIVGLMVVFAVVLPFMSKKRWWCHICPLGAVFAMLDKISFFRVRIDKNKCDRCWDCVHECRMYALTPDAVDKVGKPNEDCIRCGRCIEICPEGAVDMYLAGTSWRVQSIFISLAIIAILAWYIWFIFILLGKLTNVF